jgi:hypothetical protein
LSTQTTGGNWASFSFSKDLNEQLAQTHSSEQVRCLLQIGLLATALPASRRPSLRSVVAIMASPVNLVSFQPEPGLAREDVELRIELRDWDVPGDYCTSLAFFGFVRSNSSSPVAIEFRCSGQSLAITPCGIPGAFFKQANARGFHVRVSKLGIPPEMDLQVFLHVDEGGVRRSYLAGRLTGLPGHRLHLSYKSQFVPLLVTGAGRSGTTLLMSILAKHPEILVAREAASEFRQATYLWYAAHVLTGPANFEYSMKPDGFENPVDRVAIGYNPYTSHVYGRQLGSSSVLEWQDVDFAAATCDFICKQIDAFVSALAQDYGKTKVRYYAEKALVSRALNFVRNIYADEREIFLLRDPRDVFISAREFNRRRGGDSFGREKIATDTDWLLGICRDVEVVARSYENSRSRGVRVRYEDLVREPHQEIARILAWLEIDSSEGVVSQLVSSVSEEVRGAHGTSRSADQSIGRWQTEMSDEEKRLVTASFGETLAALGYETG